MNASHETFAQHFKVSPRRAFEYRLQTTGEPIPNEWLTEDEKAGVNNHVDTDILETDEQKTHREEIQSLEKAPTEIIEPAVEEEAKEEVTQEVEFTRDELKKKLDDADIKYFKGATAQKLADLCIENNLL